MSIERRSLAGAIAGFASFGLGFLQNVVAVPLLLRLWGQDLYGTWLAITAAMNFLSAFERGHHGYLGVEFNKLAVREPAGLRRTLASGLRVAAIIGAVQLLAACFLLLRRDPSPIQGVGPAASGAAEASLALLVLVAGNFFSSALIGVLTRLYAAFGLYARGTAIGIVQRAAQFATLIACAGAGVGIVGCALAYAVSSIAFAIVWAVEIRNRFPDVFPWWRGGEWALAVKNFARSTVLTVNGVLGEASNNGLTLAVAAFQSMSSVGTFNTIRTISNTFYQATAILIAPLGPDLARYHVEGRSDRLVALFRTIWLCGGLPINVGLVLLFPFVPALYAWWTRDMLQFDAVLFALLGWAVSVRNAASPLGGYLSGINDLRSQTLANATQAGLSLLVGFALAPALGLRAFGVGIASGELAAFAIYLHRASHLLGAPRELAAIAARNAALPALVTGIAFLAGTVRPETALVAGLVGAAALLSLYGLQWKALPLEVKTRLERLYTR